MPPNEDRFDPAESGCEGVIGNGCAQPGGAGDPLNDEAEADPLDVLRLLLLLLLSGCSGTAKPSEVLLLLAASSTVRPRWSRSEALRFAGRKAFDPGAAAAMAGDTGGSLSLSSLSRLIARGGGGG